MLFFAGVSDDEKPAVRSQECECVRLLGLGVARNSLKGAQEPKTLVDLGKSACMELVTTVVWLVDQGVSQPLVLGENSFMFLGLTDFGVAGSIFVIEVHDTDLSPSPFNDLEMVAPVWHILRCEALTGVLQTLKRSIRLRSPSCPNPQIATTSINAWSKV
ncbi:MAG: hypothetical protein DWQ37_07290 [Planctomycetota bacterium]|nr:MAG: hypothetical protein DWQ37_07290 [Planctomycetota bacterium]